LPGSENTSPSNRTVKIALKNKREIQVSENIQPDVLRRLIAVLEGD
jgi:hypothetical protein